MALTLDTPYPVRYTHGMEKEKAPVQKVTVMLPVALVAQMRQIAKAHHRSLTGEWVVAMEDYLERLKQAGARDDATR